MSTQSSITRQSSSPWSLKVGDLSYIAVFAALIAATALTPPIPLAIGVPITLQTLGVSLAGLCLGPLRGFLAGLLYLAVGAAGLPIFSSGTGGISIITGTPRGGYILSFPLSALLTGLLAWYIVRRGLSALTPVLFFVAVVITRLLVIWPLGAWGIARMGKVDFGQALVADLAFWPGDAIKAVIAALLAFAVHKAFPRLMR